MSLQKQMFMNALGACAYLGVQWLSTIIVARMLGYEAAGLLGIAINISNIFMVIAQYSMRQYQVSDVKGIFSSKIYVTSRYFTCILAIVMCIIYCLFFQYEKEMLCIVAYMLIKVSEALSDVYQGIVQKYLKYDYICFWHLIRAGVFLVTLLLGIYLLEDLGVIFSFIALELLLFVLIIEGRTSKKTDENYYKESSDIKLLLYKCFPLVIYSLAITYIPVFPRLFYEQLCGIRNLGFFMSISSPTMIINAVVSLLSAPLIPLLTSLFFDKKTKEMQKILLNTISVFSLATMLAILFCIWCGDLMLSVLFGKDILIYSYTLIPIVVSTIMISCVWTLGNILIALRKIKNLVIYAAGAVIFEVIIAPSLIEIYDMNGISFSIMISTLFLIVLCIREIYRSIKGVEGNGRLEKMG